MKLRDGKSSSLPPELGSQANGLARHSNQGYKELLYNPQQLS